MPLSFSDEVCLLNTMIAHDALIRMKGPDDQYKLGVKGQCQINIKSVLWLITRTPL